MQMRPPARRVSPSVSAFALTTPHRAAAIAKTLTTTQPVLRVDPSAIVSQYIGETEKNLSSLFKAADKQAMAILFFDEADALFGKRTSVKDAHNRYANLEISYLLQRTKASNGLVILGTNLRANIDSVPLNRFDAIVRLPFQTAIARTVLRGSTP